MSDNEGEGDLSNQTVVDVNLLKLKNERDTIVAKLSRFVNFIKTVGPDRMLEIESRLEYTPNIFREFDTIQTQIESLNHRELTSSNREMFEDSYYKSIATARGLLSEFYSNKNNHIDNSILQSQTPTHSPFAKFSLPPIDLPTYEGDYKKWGFFFQRFSALVHQNPQLSNVEKFYYLQGRLKGEALTIIQDIELTDGNYVIALNLLIERYENKKVIIEKHIDDLFDLPGVEKESSLHLRKLIDSFKQNIRSLKALGEPTDSWDRLLIKILNLKLDPNTRDKWQETAHSKAQKSIPTLAEFLEFLISRCEYLESKEKSHSVQTIKPNYTQRYQNNMSQPFTKNYNTTQNIQNKSTQKYVNLAVANMQCVYCKSSDHYIYSCRKFLNFSISERRNEIYKLGLCLNCLRADHKADSCTRGTCRVCQQKHNTLIHSNLQISHNKESENHRHSNATTSTHLTLENHADTDTPQNELQLTALTAYTNKQNVLLSTASVFLKDSEGNLIKARALLDSGSQSHLITGSLAKKLNLRTTKINIPIVGVNQTTSYISEQVNVNIRSKCNSFEENLTFLIMNQIAGNIPNFFVDQNQLNIPTNITLADPDFGKCEKIDLILGSGIFWNILSEGQINLGVNKPILQKTKLGWVISGPISNNQLKISTSNVTHCNFSVFKTLEDQIEAFWQLEECRDKPKHTSEESECEKHFLETIRRSESGRFCATLPVRQNVGELGKIYKNALKRFYKLEIKLINNPNMQNQYVEFMKEYEQLGHMSKVPEWEVDTEDKNIYYLPHHGVFKGDSLTTKLRVVFDASAQTDTGISLNDKLMVGPVIQDDLFSILIRFRRHNFVMIADIEKMYRQIQIDEGQQDLQRILWRAHPDLPLCCYKLNTVTYGTSPASFIAIRCLHELALKNESKFPLASAIIKRDFYVDDLITGCDTIEDARIVRNQIIQILSSGCFPLRKWKTNNSEIFENDIVQTDLPPHYFQTGSESKTLGLKWNSDLDTFCFCINTSNIANVSKRTILSSIAKIFDPMGIVGPVITKAKLIMQRLWQLQTTWDEAVPDDIFKEFELLKNELPILCSMTIPRQIVVFNYTCFEIHGFSDASIAAYGACLYARSIAANGNCVVRLICAKSRVAPLKTITLPRLELSGALLLAQLANKVKISLNFDSDVFLYTDSTIVLSWLKTEPSLLKTFVSNRVADIQRLTRIESWQHVNSAENPADVISRGLTPTQLKKCDIWWSGPSFLKHERLQKVDDFIPVTDLLELKQTKTKFVNVMLLDESICKRFSNFDKLQRVVAWCLRFKYNALQAKHKRKCGSLDLSELKGAQLSIIRVVQSVYFSEDLTRLKQGKQLKRNSTLLTLNPFLDEQGVIRVGGRIRKGDFQFDKKFPLLLPHDCQVTRLLIEREHKLLLHSGVQATLASLRNVYWPLRGKSIAKRVLRSCIKCFRVKPLSYHEIMGDLPEMRLTKTRPFLNSGVDYAGPFFIKETKFRNRKMVKAYLCIFVCMSTKAVHLEVASELSADTFLNVLKRFVSRRGICRNLYSDNGGCFVGADNELRALLKTISEQESISIFFDSNGIKWHFIPARSPHMGGIWEAAVKSAKSLLKRVVGTHHLSLEDFITLCTQIEGVLNSRPLIPLTDDPNDLSPLTPGHFLIGDALTAIPQIDVQDMLPNRLSAFHAIQRLYQIFWTRWRKEYISHLQQRMKWKTPSRQKLKVGDLVLLQEDETPPLCWPLGRISELHQGQDGVVRVVSLRVRDKSLKRAVSRICALPNLH